MTSAEELKQLLKNAFNEGFTVEDISDIAKDIELEHEAEVESEEYIDELQNDATEALVDFLFEVGYLDEEAVYDEQFDAVYAALQMIRDGKIKMSIKTNEKSYNCSGSCKSNKSYEFDFGPFKTFTDDINLEKLKETLKKYF